MTTIRRVLLGACVLAGLVTVNHPASAAPLFYDEAISGEVDQTYATSPFLLDLGVNRILGTTGCCIDFDSFAFDIPAGLHVHAGQPPVSRDRRSGHRFRAFDRIQHRRRPEPGWAGAGFRVFRFCRRIVAAERPVHGSPAAGSRQLRDAGGEHCGERVVDTALRMESRRRAGSQRPRARGDRLTRYRRARRPQLASKKPRRSPPSRVAAACSGRSQSPNSRCRGPRLRNVESPPMDRDMHRYPLSSSSCNGGGER